MKVSTKPGQVHLLSLQKSGDDLRVEAERLRRLNVLIIRGLEEAGLARFARDASGEPSGLVINLKGVAEGRSSAHGNLSVTSPSPATKAEDRR